MEKFYRDDFHEWLARASRGDSTRWSLSLEVDFLPFATGVGANVESQSAYASDPVQQNGYNTGIAPSAQVGKVNRQGNFFSAVLAQFIATVSDANVLDDGNLTGKLQQLWQAYLAEGYFVDGGTTGALLLANPVSPAGALTFVTPQAGTRVTVKVADNNTGASTLDWMGVNTSPILKSNGAALTGGELLAGRLIDLDYDGANWQIAGSAATPSPYGANPTGVVCGGYLTVESATSLQFAQFTGTQVPIAGVFQTIPGTPITISNAGLADSTLYYVYVYENAGTMTLALSTTGHVLGPNGYEIMSGNAAYTFLGWVYTSASGQFVPLSQQNILCVNYYNPTGLPGYVAIVAATASSSPVELSSAKRISFISPGQVLFGFATGEQSNNTGSEGGAIYLYLDGTQWSPVSGTGTNPTANLPIPVTAFGNLMVAEGYHQMATYGVVVNSGTATFNIDTTLTVNG